MAAEGARGQPRANAPAAESTTLSGRAWTAAPLPHGLPMRLRAWRLLPWAACWYFGMCYVAGCSAYAAGHGYEESRAEKFDR